MRSLVTILMCVGMLGGCQTMGPPSRPMPLKEAIQKATKALDAYQKDPQVLGSDLPKLPPLASADFEFKVGTTYVGGVDVTFVVFTLGATTQTDVTSDITFTYEPKTPAQGLLVERDEFDLENELTKAIKSAAKAWRDSPAFQDTTLTRLAIEIDYGITNDGKLSVSFPVGAVTLGPSVEASRAAVQSVRLTFATQSK
jgi:hypothetical protein